MPETMVATPDPDEPKYEVINLTPELAKKWLGQNTHNRNLRQRVVNGYAADMAAGNWVEDGQSIKFSRTGVLLDGQHRLSAVAQSGVTVRMLVVSNLPESTQDVMDTGAKRVLGDVLKLRGESYSITLAAALLRVYQWKQGYRKNLKSAGNARPTHRQLLQVLDEHPELRRSVEVADRMRKAARISGSSDALCHWLFNQIDPDDCAFFFARFGDGVALLDNDPIYVLRRVLKNFADDRGRPEEALVTALVIKAWNAFREGRTVSLLAYRPGGARPEPYPEPK
jgi:hypothetical protein